MLMPCPVIDFQGASPFVNTYEYMNTYMNIYVDLCMYVWMDGCMYGCIMSYILYASLQPINVLSHAPIVSS